MIAPQAALKEYDARIERVGLLSARHFFAKEVLTFYGRIAGFQKRFYRQLAGANREATPLPQFGPVRGSLDLTVLLPHFPDFLSLVGESAPEPLAKVARELASVPSDEWITPLQTYWESGGRSDHQTGVFEEFFPRAFLEPYAAFLAAQMAAPLPTTTCSLCPLCGSRPLLGVLRPEGDGGKRSLVCSFCSYEWDFRRILCPACGEEEEKKLPVYVAEQFPHIRVECCETCKFFLRTVDLTKDGHAVAVVDDIAAIPLTLWAHEHQFNRLQSNLLGT